MKTCEDNGKVRAIWEVKTWIRGHLDAPLSIEMLAARGKMSVRTFYRVFERVAGESPAEHIQRLRLVRGAAWLAYGNAGVMEAALAAGYESREAFTRMFRKHYGCSPKVYRQRQQTYIRKLADLPAPGGVRLLGLRRMSTMTLLAYPCVGTLMCALQTWASLDAQTKQETLLGPLAQPATVFFDNGITLPPGCQERVDMACRVNDTTASSPVNGAFIRYRIPGGRFAIAEYSGRLDGITRARDYFTLGWFLNSGLQMADTRCLILISPSDILSETMPTARAVASKKILCQLCIKVDTVAGDGVPVLGAHTRRR